MDIFALRYAYDCGGYDSTFSLGAWFLRQNTREYGQAINEIWVSVFFQPEQEPRPTLGSLHDAFERSLQDLPKVRVYRKKKSVEIGAVTHVTPAHRRHFYLPEPPLFREGLKELERILSLLKGRIKKSDDFNLEAFLTDVRTAVSCPPTTTTEIERLKESHSAYLQKKAESAGPWDRLGIDWSDYHRNARKILNDPFIWEESNDYAPHGNDTGADVLTSYQEWRKAHRRADPLEFLNELLVGWRVNIALERGGDVATIKQLIEQDEFSIDTYDDAMIGLVFACLKIDGKVKPEIASTALQSIARQSIASVIQRRGWGVRHERIATLEKTAASLRPFAGKPGKLPS